MGPVIAIGTWKQATKSFAQPFRTTFSPSPNAPEIVQPLLAVVPLRLLAPTSPGSRSATSDEPRNPAKSVTVE